MKLILTFFLLFEALTSLGTTFTVTSNADSGPGTFREALEMAAANGTAVPDQIVFNITDISRAGRTITLLSTLPALSSSLVIDGTTQPGAPFGISNARVQIQNTNALQYFSFFQAYQVSNLEIYGLYLFGDNLAGYALEFRQAHNIRFGAAGKGNMVNGFAEAFNSDYQLGTDPSSSDVSIQGNLLGIDESGDMLPYGLINGVNFWLRNVANLQIGGLNPGEGNLMCEQNYGMNYTCSRPENFGYLKIQGNTIGTDRTGLVKLDPNKGEFSINGYNDGSGSLTGTTSLNVEITNNISAESFNLVNLQDYFKIQGNHIGVGPDNVTPIYSGFLFALAIEFCGQGIIGGPNAGDKNYIANSAGGDGVYEFWCTNITISRNSFFCNGIGIDYAWLVPNRPMPFVTINTLGAGSVGGKALPNSTIELFYDDECPGCEGKTYIGSTTADNNGDWNYAVTATGAIVATGTDTHGATSMFSVATINTDNVVVQDATCGGNNGSVKRVQVISGTDWHWEDAQGNIVGTNIDLLNVGPGNYTFVTSIGGNACQTSSNVYTVKNISLPMLNTTDIRVTQPTCGQNSGTLQYIAAFDPSVKYQWVNAAGAVICPDFSVSNPFAALAPGDYTLQLALQQDPACQAQYGPFVLVNQAGPSLNTAPLRITPSTCGKSNGALTNISYQNATGTVCLAWEDSTGHIVSNSLDLVNAPGGPYRLLFKDGGGCDTIFTPYYRIPGSNFQDESVLKATVEDASCDANNGSVRIGQYLKDPSLYSFEWIDSTTHAILSSTDDARGLAPGLYVLNATDVNGCSKRIYTARIRQLGKPVIDPSALQLNDDSCNAGEGAIKNLRMQDPARSYSWAWYTGQQQVGNGAGGMTALHAGSYYVSVTDQYSCTVNSDPFIIRNIDYTPVPPQLTDQDIPRNTSTTLTVGNPQRGTYDLLGSDGVSVLGTSASGSFQTPVITADISFFVRFTRGECSSSLSQVNIKVFDSTRIFVPNAFTPNNDGYNDKWHIIIQGKLNSFNLSVFDRWGMLVYSSSNPGAYWDGRMNGHPLSGVFVYTITGRDFYNRTIKLNGTVIIIR